jgi:hypothetical protein
LGYFHDFRVFSLGKLFTSGFQAEKVTTYYEQARTEKHPELLLKEKLILQAVLE